MSNQLKRSLSTALATRTTVISTDDEYGDVDEEGDNDYGDDESIENNFESAYQDQQMVDLDDDGITVRKFVPNDSTLQME